MDEPRFFADVDLPFHVWVREGRRWVLRDASRLERDRGERDRADTRGALPEPRRPRQRP
jgi:hypothetical protein